VLAVGAVRAAVARGAADAIDAPVAADRAMRARALDAEGAFAAALAARAFDATDVVATLDVRARKLGEPPLEGGAIHRSSFLGAVTVEEKRGRRSCDAGRRRLAAWRSPPRAARCA